MSLWTRSCIPFACALMGALLMWYSVPLLQLSLEFVQVDTPQVAPEADVHKDSIMAIAKIPSQIGLHDKYATVSKDGTLKIWSAKDFSILKTIGEAKNMHF